MADASTGGQGDVEKLTPEQKEEIRQAFAFYDRDGDEKIKAAELGIVVRSLGHAPTESEIRSFAKEADAGGTGLITWPEFLRLAAYLTAHPIDKQERARNAFKVFDSDKDGRVSARELRHCLTTLGDKLSKDEIDEAYREAGITDEAELDINAFLRLMGVC
eukprot:m51a1_g11490 putative calmodulin (161) ;mRNA; r:15451-16074